MHISLVEVATTIPPSAPPMCPPVPPKKTKTMQGRGPPLFQEPPPPDPWVGQVFEHQGGRSWSGRLRAWAWCHHPNAPPRRMSEGGIAHQQHTQVGVGEPCCVDGWFSTGFRGSRRVSVLTLQSKPRHESEALKDSENECVYQLREAQHAIIDGGASVEREVFRHRDSPPPARALAFLP